MKPQNRPAKTQKNEKYPMPGSAALAMTNEINSNQRTFFKALNALFIESKG
ncbi:MAG: hypothetical protein RR100_21930 [Comamonas sp.]